ncbi:transmembrane and coiled-coil domain-containing protein 6 isoform X1 [Lagopus muta]|uniref:transmembrane and coiled-coil domain-containing protein 6 isoform X1 n=1 Tax=Lagopus muta TaxID=64668 RepID=UPI00209D01A4|nr:transmembrane and coiled-coil domain-containing protein 6 isoform X1 [Lagopus muta]
MWGRRRGAGPGGGAEELRARRREREAALRKARREQQLVSKRLLREDEAERGQDGAERAVLDPVLQGEVSELLRGVQRGSEDRRGWLRRLRRALQSKETQQEFVRLDGAVRTLVGLFTCSLPDVQLEAARCLHELSHSSDAAVAEACVPVTSYLLTYLSGHSIELMELCLYTLGNLVVESEVVRKKLLPQGIIPVLASCIQSPHEAVLEGLGYVLSQLLQAKEAPAEIIPLVLDSVLPQHMLRLVCSGLKFGTGAAVEFAWCLHYIVYDVLFCSHTANVELMSLGAVPALTSLLCDIASEISPSDSEGLELLICPVLRCLGNLLAEETGREAQPQDERLLVALFIIMHCYLQQHPFLIPESLWLLNNLTADEPFFCSALLSMDLLPALLQLLPHSQTVSTLVLTVLCNIAEKGPAYCQQLHQQAALPLLLHVLVVPDPEVVGQCLELLHLLFLHWPQVAADFVKQGGHQTLEQHQSTPELQERVRVLLEMALQPLGASAFSSSSTALSTFSQMT